MAVAPAGSRGTRDLTRGAILPTLLAFALPTLGVNVLESLTISVNAMWVGRLLGPNAMAAMANTAPTLFLLFAMGIGLGIAVSVMIGQARGRGDGEAVKRVFGTAVILFLILSVVLATIGVGFAPALLHLLGTPEPAYADALVYSRLIFAQLPLILFLIMFAMVMRGLGDSITPMIWTSVALISDTLLNPLLILGGGPFPAMGIAGSALANAVSHALAVAGMIWTLRRPGHALRFEGSEWRWFRLDRAIAIGLAGRGAAISLQMQVVSLAAIAMVGLVNGYGIMETAAYGAAVQIWNYLNMPSMGFGAAVSAMAAQNIGAQLWDRVERVTWVGIGLTLGVTAVLILFVRLFDTALLGLFLGPASGEVAHARHILDLTYLAFLFFAVGFVLMAAMRANGVVLVPLAITAFSLLPVRIGLASWGQGHWGEDALWWSFPISSALSALLAFLYYRYGGWRRARRLIVEREKG